MKTYLAGARLLIQRKRPDEALASFQRIDDLIDRMGAITRQLKSYARKGSDAFEPFDVRDAVSSALAMMEPQLKTRRVAISRTLPDRRAMILGDRLRLEQVLINLLRNALDATREVKEPAVDILLAAGQTVSVTVRDNGPGIEDLDALFEPFYTTKQPGDGVGLGLAISSGIVNDLGGRLTARNARDGGRCSRWCSRDGRRSGRRRNEWGSGPSGPRGPGAPRPSSPKRKDPTCPSP
jgi:two-component system C4-dicarboxylate transport sensor histidine kinase DctB